MTGNDTLSDALSGVNNAESVGHLRHTIRPASNLIRDVLDVFAARGYIDGFEHVEDGKAGKFEVELRGAINACGSIKPRYAVGGDEFEDWEVPPGPELRRARRDHESRRHEPRRGPRGGRRRPARRVRILDR